ncbi:MAG: hypothetical protein AAF567_10905 [Actinomycetota bacterium]
MPKHNQHSTGGSTHENTDPRAQSHRLESGTSHELRDVQVDAMIGVPA